MESLGNLLFLPLLFVAMYFLLVRPQRKRQQEVAAMQRALGVGSDVITIGGLHGRVVELHDDAVDLEVTEDGTVLRFKRSAIADIVTDPDVDDLDDELDDELDDDFDDDLAEGSDA